MRTSFKWLCICAVSTAALAMQAADLDQATYLRFDAGLSIVNDIELTSVGPFGAQNAEADVDAGVRLDLAGGYNFSEQWAVELELGCVGNRVKQADWDLFQVPILANVIYTIPLESRFNPYVGAGAGGTFGFALRGISLENDFTFAFQGLAGVDYEVSDTFKIGIGYKFLGTLDLEFFGAGLDNVYTHSILAVFKWGF